MFGPFDLPIVIGDPSKRRTFLDEAVTALWPLKESAFTTYERVAAPAEPAAEGVGPSRCARRARGVGRAAGAGGDGRDRRRAHEAIERLAPHAAAEFEHLAGYELVVRYAPERVGCVRPRGRVPREDRGAPRRRARAGARRSSARIATTSTLAVRDLGARSAGSHGETWATALCLRIGLATAVTDELGEPPVLLVDDPYSALDPARRDRLLHPPGGACRPGLRIGRRRGRRADARRRGVGRAGRVRDAACVAAGGTG